MAIMPVMSLLQIVWISLPRVLILLKCHHFGISRSFREICFEYSLMPRSSHLRLLNAGKVEIWTPGFYVTLKSMSVTFMDSMFMFIVQTLGLQLMRCERPLLIRLSLTRLLFLLPESLLTGLISLTLEFYWEFCVYYVLDNQFKLVLNVNH